MLQPQRLARRRARREHNETRVLLPGDDGFEETLSHAIREPFADAIETRMPWTPLDQAANLLGAFREELRQREEGVTR